MSSLTKNTNRRNCVPIIYTRGTHYEIGFDIGKTFAEMIAEYVQQYWPLHQTYLPLYQSAPGKKLYEQMLANVEKQYPQYIREIRGTADGSGVAFHKLFLMHLDEIMPNVAANGAEANSQAVGCSTVICNRAGQQILGHNEDALSETLNHWYLVDAHVIEHGYPEEKFCSLSYAGFLPGYTMGYNHHGLVYSVNTLYAKDLRCGKTPRYFLARALLAADNYERVERILRNEGYGAAEGFAINMSFQQQLPRTFYNIEVAPSESSSKLSTIQAHSGQYFYHCNNYLRIQVAQVERAVESSIHRAAAIDKHPSPENRRDVLNILSDQTDHQLPVYRVSGERSKTVATGVFDFLDKTWAIYTDKPNCTKPLVILPMRFENDV